MYIDFSSSKSNILTIKMYHFYITGSAYLAEQVNILNTMLTFWNSLLTKLIMRMTLGLVETFKMFNSNIYQEKLFFSMKNIWVNNF